MPKKNEDGPYKDKIYTATVSDLDTYLTVALNTPIIKCAAQQHPSDPACIWGYGVNLVGLNATRKSDMLEQIGMRTNTPVFKALAPIRQPEDFAGAAMPVQNGIVIECILPAARSCLASPDGSILFIDETSDAPRATLAALHNIPVERKVGDHSLPPRTRCVTAMNPPEFATVGHGISSGIASRFAHVWVPPPTRLQWRTWMRGRLKPLMTMVDAMNLVIQNWNQHWPLTMSITDKFMERTEDSTLHDQPKPDDPRSGGPWANPRGWHYFICARTALKCLGAPAHLEFEILETLMGPAVVKLWTEWLAKSNLPSIEDMLQGNWELNKTRLDYIYMCMTYLCEHVRAMAIEDKALVVSQAAGAWVQVERVYDGGLGDIAVEPAQELCRAGMGADAPDANVRQVAERVIEKMTEGGYSAFAENR